MARLGPLLVDQRTPAEELDHVGAINSNDAERYPEDSFEEMKVRAQREGFSFNSLYDEDQSVAQAYGPVNSKPACQSRTRSLTTRHVAN